MRRVSFMASAMSVALAALITGAQNAAAIPAGALAAADISAARIAPFIEVQWDGGYGNGNGYNGYGYNGYGNGYGYNGNGYDNGFDRWKHLPGWDAGYNYDDAYLPNPYDGPVYRPCCQLPPPPPRPCCTPAPAPYIPPASYVPPEMPYTPLK